MRGTPLIYLRSSCCVATYGLISCAILVSFDQYLLNLISLHCIYYSTLPEHQKFWTDALISITSDTTYNYFQSTILIYQLEYVACIICAFNSNYTIPTAVLCPCKMVNLFFISYDCKYMMSCLFLAT